MERRCYGLSRACGVAAGFLTLAALLAAPVARSQQTDGAEKAEAMSAEHDRLASYYEIEYAMRELMWHQAMSILAAYGDYNSYQIDGKETNADDLSRLKNRIDWNRQSLADFKRQTLRDKGASDETVKLMQEVITAYGPFLDSAAKVADLLAQKDPQAANITYRDTSVPISKDIGSSLYTLRAEAQARYDTVERQP